VNLVRALGMSAGASPDHVVRSAACLAAPLGRRRKNNNELQTDTQAARSGLGMEPCIESGRLESARSETSMSESLKALVQ